MKEEYSLLGEETIHEEQRSVCDSSKGEEEVEKIILNYFNKTIDLDS